MRPQRAPLYDQVRTELLELIRTGALELENHRLPAESELAVALGVSRATLREALQALERDGLLVRKQGIGSFVFPHFHQASPLLDRMEGLPELLRGAGMTVQVEYLYVGDAHLDASVAADLGGQPGDPAWRVRYRCLADGRPVVLLDAVFPHTVIESREVLEAVREHESITAFLAQRMGVLQKWAMLKVRAVAAAGEVAEALELAEGHPVLLMEGPSYDDRVRHCNYSTVHVNTDIYPFMLLRR